MDDTKTTIKKIMAEFPNQTQIFHISTSEPVLQVFYDAEDKYSPIAFSPSILEELLSEKFIVPHPRNKGAISRYLFNEKSGH
jgi:hypothetical protein